MENYAEILCHMSLISEIRHNISLLTFFVTLFVLRVLMAYHAELNLGIWSICTLQSSALLMHNPRNFVSDKLAINYFHVVIRRLSHEHSLF
jgi:hypothetical protein